MVSLAQTSNNDRVRLGGPAPYDTYAIAKRIQVIDEHLSLQGKRILDLGCGIGSYTEKLAQRARWTCGLDILESNLQTFRQPIPRVQGIGENLPFATASFDAVTMIEVLEHTISDTQVLRECFRVLKPAGFLILFVPNKLYPLESHPCKVGRFSLGHNIPLVSWAPGWLRKYLCPVRIYTLRKLVSLAKTEGFELRANSYIFPPVDSFPLPSSLKQVYRALARCSERTPMKVFGVSIFAVFERPRLPESVNGAKTENAKRKTILTPRPILERATVNCS
jgi:ubiquinone/menaquinone biosynthesis C-methylase UbiE